MRKGCSSSLLPKIAKAVDVAKASPETLAAALAALAKAGLSEPAVRDVFTRAARDRDWRKRVVAMDALGRSGDPAGADILIRGIEDDAWQVRLAAVEGLGGVRVKRAVPLLIDRLEDEESPRVRRAVAESLFRTTAENYYDIVKLWRRWWTEHGEAFRVPAVVPKPTSVGVNR